MDPIFLLPTSFMQLHYEQKKNPNPQTPLFQNYQSRKHLPGHNSKNTNQQSYSKSESTILRHSLTNPQNSID